MRELNLDQLRTLVTIADLGTFAAAARALHLAPPTVSLHIGELESRLGASLLERGSRGVRLTAPGGVLVERGRQLLKEADATLEQVRRVAEGRAGKVRLGTSTGVLVHLLPQVLERLARAVADVEVDVVILGSGETMARLQARTLDLGIVALPQAGSPGLDVQPWRSDPMMAFLPPRWTDVPASVTPAWLADRPLVANDASTLMHRLTAGWFGEAGLQPRARIELNYTEAMKSLVAAGYGAAVLPMEWLDEVPADVARLQMRPLDPPLTRHLGLAHRPRALLDAATAEVLRVLLDFTPAAVGAGAGSA
ncbi:DNA-binding transcriptional LysR family regulator [Sphaerotilus hippei]|uniref:DNA-binding transcriptional LysR family regulator n=1 Tax=Sphaerotilus hippei TaxID=744406 RepID=A0A318H871_9BURK|nr:LysR family transcriptional regulator [Sphaerotilus hippei]PXW96113.1 DNA-binding transcriptional LysR family regulator [Sphaerotilus hippei]